MLKINIESKYTINEKIQNNNTLTGKYCISILSPEQPNISKIDKHFKKTLKLKFHDITSINEHTDETKPILFNKKHLRKIIKFYKRLKKEKVDKITIHCHAGVHRSTAVALILYYLETNSYTLSKELLIKSRAIPLPNKRVLETFDKTYGTQLINIGHELDKRFKAFVYDEIVIDRDNYLEELEVVD